MQSETSRFGSRAENIGHEDVEYFTELLDEASDDEAEDVEGDEGDNEDIEADVDVESGDPEDYEADPENYRPNTEADATPGEQRQQASQYRMDMRRAAARERDLADQQRAA